MIQSTKKTLFQILSYFSTVVHIRRPAYLRLNKCSRLCLQNCRIQRNNPNPEHRWCCDDPDPFLYRVHRLILLFSGPSSAPFAQRTFNVATCCGSTSAFTRTRGPTAVIFAAKPSRHVTRWSFTAVFIQVKEHTGSLREHGNFWYQNAS